MYFLLFVQSEHPLFPRRRKERRKKNVASTDVIRIGRRQTTSLAGVRRCRRFRRIGDSRRVTTSMNAVSGRLYFAFFRVSCSRRCRNRNVFPLFRIFIIMIIFPPVFFFFVGEGVGECRLARSKPFPRVTCVTVKGGDGRFSSLSLFFLLPCGKS